MLTYSQLTTLIGAGFVTSGVFYGLGRHEYYLTPFQRLVSHALGWADWIQTFITLALVKISICLFLLRIVESRMIKRGMYAIIAFTVLFTTIFVCLFLGICRPLNAHWNVEVEGKCFSDIQIRDMLIAQGGESPTIIEIHVYHLHTTIVLSVIVDLVIAGLPIIFLRKLQISRRTKFGLCLLMGLGVMYVPLFTHPLLRRLHELTGFLPP